MKKLIILLLFPVISYGQSIPVAKNTFGTLADMRAQVGTDKVQVLLNGLTAVGDNNGGTYMWNATSTAADDGYSTIQVTGTATGRWIRLVNANTIKGSKTLSGTILQTAYPISFDTTLPAIPAMVIIQAYSANAAVPSWVSNVTTTGFTANFSSVPVLGTNNITIYYLIIKL
jgi:hypothetical protein